MLTSSQAAKKLGVTPRRVIAMITAGQLHSEKFGHIHMIHESDLAKIPDVRKPGPKPAKPGRPKKKA